MGKTRAHHYLGAGLGDGKLRGRTSSLHQPAAGGEGDDWYQSRSKNSVRGNNPNNINPQHQQPYSAQQERPGVDPVTLYMRAEKNASDVDPWQFSALALLGVVVILSAIFLQIISDAVEKNSQSYRQRQRRSTTTSPRTKKTVVAKKKTDEWNEDEEEMESADNPARDPTSAEIDTSRPPSVYYPYQPRLQQHRHRKVSSTTSSTGVTPTIVMPSTPVNLQLTRSYHQPPNGGGSALLAAPGYSAVGGMPSRSCLRTGSPPPRHANDASFSQSAVVSNNARQGYVQGQNPTYSRGVIAEQALLEAPHSEWQHGERPSMHPRVLSDASSFDTIGDQSDHSNSTVNSNYNEADTGSPAVSDRKSHLVVSPGSADRGGATPKAGQVRAVKIADTVVDQTPRVANGGRQAMCIYQGYHRSLESECKVEPPHTGSTSDSMAFASPPRIQDRKGSPDNVRIPYVPHLEADAVHPPPPKSVNLDDLHLYHMMESGNVSHWKERVAEESRMLEQLSKEPVWPKMTTEGSADSPTLHMDIPSGDPRKAIHHKRPVLTEFSDAASSLSVPIDFAELKLVEVIGGGGFGQVWRAVWRGTPVAVKVLTGSAQARNVPKVVLEEFAAEINLLKGMRHPNICLYMGACLMPPNRAIVTELAANGSLWDALRLPLSQPHVACDGLSQHGWPLELYRPDPKYGIPPSSTSWIPTVVPPKGTWPYELVRRVARGAARGMAYLHSGKPPVLHRDLKSANVLLDESYTAKICDFGLSRLKEQERSMTGNCGTVQWMAPEVLANQSYNEKADVFSYGIICWELLTRQCPYDGMSAIQCALAVLNRNHRPEIPKWCPPAYGALIRSCVKKNPDERPTFVQILLAFDSMK